MISALIQSQTLETGKFANPGRPGNLETSVLNLGQRQFFKPVSS